ncbi:MAG: hypothetical protein WCW44_02510 [archaeon]|jgi:hypothetical protein
MAKVIGKNITLNSEETSLLGEGKEFELIPNNKGVFLLIDKSLLKEKEGQQVCVSVPQKENLEEEAQQVIGLIKQGKLGDLVEGKFELTLNEKQKKALLELILKGTVFVFKLNETYKKGVYRVKEEELPTENNPEKKESESINAPEKPFDKYTLEEDGFLIIKGKESAARASFQFEKDIKEGLLKGIKSFDGNYYLIQTDLLQNYISKAMGAFTKKSTQSLEELSTNLKVSKMLMKVICEFLKDEGEVMERKKGMISYIR